MTASSEAATVVANDNTAGNSNNNHEVSEKITLLPATIKGKADWRDFRSFQLNNGVRCTVVHDPESKMFAAAAVVDTGAGADPRHMPGVAHFVEHCLFLGSEKYPGKSTPCVCVCVCSLC